MDKPRTGPLLIAVRVDALRAGGVGHAVRQLALAEELVARGHRVVMVGESEVAWVSDLIAAAGLPLVAPAPVAEVVTQMQGLGAGVVMIDGYDIAAETGQRLMAAGVPVATMVDGHFGTHQIAALYVDQNLNASRPRVLPASARFVGGLDYSLLRSQIVTRRGVADPGRPGVPRVLVVFGGTDAFDGARVLVPLVLQVGVPVEVVAVAATSAIAESLRGLQCGPGQKVSVTPPVADLGALAVTCQAAVSAAGTSVWEMLCLGLPTGLVCVTDNQEFGYLETARARSDGVPVCLPVGKIQELRSSQEGRAAAREQLRALVTDSALREAMSAAGRRLVDGEGRVRVADELERLAGFSAPRARAMRER